MDDAQLPRAVQLLWAPPEPARRGPKPGLTRETVVRTAIEIADADGLGQLSMSRIAERLGFTTMSLYRYVASKDDLLTLMPDAVNTVPPPPEPDDWRAGLQAWSRQILAGYRQHPWLLQLPISGPPAGPNQLAWMEAGLQNLARVQVPAGLQLAIIQLLFSYVRGQAQFSHELAAAAGPALPYGEVLRALVRDRPFPALARVVESGVFDENRDYTDSDFDFGLDRILDGIATLIEQDVERHVGQDPDRDLDRG